LDLVMRFLGPKWLVVVEGKEPHHKVVGKLVVRAKDPKQAECKALKKLKEETGVEGEVVRVRLATEADIPVVFEGYEW